MQLGIISDTHDELDRARQAVELLQVKGADVLVHCGDLSGPGMVALYAVLPFYFVFGNWDADSVPALRLAAAEYGATCLEWGDILELEGKRIGVVHGHMRTDLRRVLAERPDYLLSGHSHIASHRREGSV